MNNIYLYDGSFSSLILLILKIIELNDINFNIKNKNDYVLSFFDTPIILKLDKSKLMIEKNKLPRNVIHASYYVYLSSYENKELLIYDFIKNSLKYKNIIFYQRNIESVNKVIKISNYVRRETHKLKGFLRFKEMKNNFYYAEISPTNNIITLLAKHFKERFKNEYFVIKDVKRKIYALYNKKNILYLNEDDIIELNLNLSDNEEFIENLWKNFFDTIGIKERENKRCQQNFMPKKYWNYIIEMEDKK